MKLYNTLTRQLEELKLRNAKQVKIYSCGPTVYNFAHIGNLRAFIFADTLRRSLDTLGYDVMQVMNITDVGHLVSDADDGEDKLEKGALREGKTVWQVAEYYTEAFIQDMRQLNILPPNGYNDRPDGYARATDFIETQLAMVNTMLQKQYAYITKQAIYFNVTKLASYGRLSGQKLDDKEVAARDDVVTDPDKRHPFDFAIWFFKVGHFADHSMHWPSPWGDGFPGWHLECSAIIHATLGDPIDIHTGGVDHIGTHHTNEMAQTEATFGNHLANYWLHNEFVMVDGKKMSKSEGNFYILSDITERGYNPAVFRLLCLQAHYRSHLNFTWDGLEAAQNRLKNLQAFADLRWQLKDLKSDEYSFDKYQANLLENLGDDLNTPAALASLSHIIDELESGLSPQQEESFLNLLTTIDTVFGLNLQGTKDINKSQKKMIEQREAARETKDFVAADRLRDQLIEQGLHIKDTAHGQIWSRI